MVYSAVETTCFGLYWPSSGFYNIEEESINAVKTVRGLLIKRSLYQSPDHSLPSARAICKHGEKIINREKLNSQTQPQSLCSPKKNTPHLHTGERMFLCL